MKICLSILLKLLKCFSLWLGAIKSGVMIFLYSVSKEKPLNVVLAVSKGDVKGNALQIDLGYRIELLIRTRLETTVCTQ